MIRHITTNVTFSLILGLLLQYCGSTSSSRVTYTSMADAKVDGSTVLGEIYNRDQTVQRFGDRSRGKRQTDNTSIDANKTVVFEDHHDYYTSQFISSSEESSNYWFELGTLIGSGAMLQDDVMESIIQGFHRYYEIWDLKFDFQFYGHFINRIAVTTGGFVYTGTFFHDQVHLTQFIAPLQADFNPTIANDSKILIYSTEERFTAQWDGVHNHDHDDVGPFTFQVSLFPNGSIHFVYREIPLPVSEINNDDHPVEVGLADAFYYDIFQGIFRIRYVYEYSRIKLNANNDLSYTAYIINPLPNCVQGSTCDQCTNLTEISSFECSWCPVINRCSDGLDRHTQDWIDSDCQRQARSHCGRVSPSSSSPSIETTPTSTPPSSSSISTTASETTPTPVIRHSSSTPSPGAISGIVLVLLVVVAVVVVVAVGIAILIYGHKRPTSRVGLFLIEHRPKAWSLNRTDKYEMKTEKMLLD